MIHLLSVERELPFVISSDSGIVLVNCTHFLVPAVCKPACLHS